MCAPDYFDVVDSKNAFMSGNRGAVDRELAMRQWQDLVAVFERLGHRVHQIKPAEGLEDMVFCANQVLPWVDEQGQSHVILSQMRHESRRREVPHFAQWFSQRGYKIHELTEVSGAKPFFEGQGDAIWHPGRKLLWGGVGARTQDSAYDQIESLTGARVVRLRLTGDTYYHLDTAFSALSEDVVLIYPGAFEMESLDAIVRAFANVLVINEEDASNFAGNCLALGRQVILQKGSARTAKLLGQTGFEVLEVETGEFMKSGGSVFCLKMMVY